MRYIAQLNEKGVEDESVAVGSFPEKKLGCPLLLGSHLDAKL